MLVIQLAIHPALLHSAEAGCRLADDLVSMLNSSSDTLEIDLSRVDRMTPSFANALVMTLLHAVSREIIRERVRFVNAQPIVIAAINSSIRRFDSGIRLSTQLTGVA